MRRASGGDCLTAPWNERRCLPAAPWSPVSQNRVRLIGLGKRNHLCRFELEVEGLQGVLKVFDPACANNRRGYARLGDKPGERHLRIGYAAVRRDLGHPIDDPEI